MGIKESQYKKILKDYELKRERSNKELRLRQEEIYAKIPRIAEIDNILASTGIEISKAILQNPEKSEELIHSLEQKNLDLIIEKAELLYINGYNKII